MPTETTTTAPQPEAAPPAAEPKADKKAAPAKKEKERENTLDAGMFAAAVKRPATVVGVMLPTVGVQVHLKQLGEDERAKLAPTAAERKEPGDHLSRVLAMSMCYADGSQKFDEAAKERILAAQPGELAQAYSAACHLNGLSPLPVVGTAA